MPPEHEKPGAAVTAPSSSAPVATAILKVEPGGNCPCTARLLRGRWRSWTSARHSSGRMPRAKTFGSKAGWETMTRISPLRGSRATIAPAASPRARSAASWRSRSSVSVSVLPGTSGTSWRTRMRRPRASTSTCCPPGIPRRSPSQDFSRLALPTRSPDRYPLAPSLRSASLTSPTYPRRWLASGPKG